MENSSINVNTYRIRVKIGDRELEVEGDKDFVTETCLNLHARLLEVPETLALERAAIIFDAHNEATLITNGKSGMLESNGSSAVKTLPLASYLKKSSANTDSDRVLVIAAYLFQNRGKAEFTKADIEQCYRDALLKKSTNVNRDINSNRKKGYFDVHGEKDGLMSFYITQEGLEIVQKMIGS